MNDAAELLEFSNRIEFRNWLTKNHHQQDGIWIVFNKGDKQFTANDALEESICFGWIDGVIKSIDKKCYKKYFSKRRDVHNWSAKNKSLYEKLVSDGFMADAGTEAFQPDKRIQKPEIAMIDKIQIIRDILKDDMEILHLYDAKPPSRQKQFAGFYCEAKTEETRTKRKNKIIEALRSNDAGMLY